MFKKLFYIFFPAKATDSVHKKTETLENQVSRQQRQIEMCFSLLFELCEKQDEGFANFVQQKKAEHLDNLTVVGFKRYE